MLDLSINNHFYGLWLALRNKYGGMFVKQAQQSGQEHPYDALLVSVWKLIEIDFSFFS